MLHSSYSIGSPEQVPPCSSTTNLLLVFVLIPVPQVFEHSPISHSSHSQWIAWTNIENIIKFFIEYYALNRIRTLHQRIINIPYLDSFGCCIPQSQSILQCKLHQSFLRSFLIGCWFAFLLRKFCYTHHIANLSIRNQLKFYDQQKIILVECFVGNLMLFQQFVRLIKSSLFVDKLKMKCI